MGSKIQKGKGEILMQSIRNITKKDKYGLIGIQRAVYPPPFNPNIWHWNFAQLKSQLKAEWFSFVYEKDLELLGSVMAFRTNRHDIEHLNTWDEITDGGHFNRHNSFQGDTIYLADIAVKPKCHNHEGTALLNVLKKITDIYQTKKITDIYQTKYIIGGARLSHSHLHEGWTPREYAEEVANGTLKDPTTEFFKSNGFTLGKVLPDYIEDHESRNHAVEIIWENEKL
jgi:hypothetical protein